MDSPLDAMALAALRDLGDHAFLVEMIDLYLSESQALLQVLDRAARADDFSALARTAHSLKSTSAAVGATVVARIAFEIETAALGGSLQDGRSLLDALNHQYVRTQQALMVERGRAADLRGEGSR